MQPVGIGQLAERKCGPHSLPKPKAGLADFGMLRGRLDRFEGLFKVGN